MPVCYHPTPIGTACITEQDGFITSVKLVENDVTGSDTPGPVLELAMQQLDEYFAGTRREFNLPLKQPGTSFQQLVWQQLLGIGYGKSISYAQLSKQMLNPLAIRAIASANGKNNLWIIVPCHRVIGTDGTLTGYAGGLWRKKWLLEHEARIAGIGQVLMNF